MQTSIYTSFLGISLLLLAACNNTPAKQEAVATSNYVLHEAKYTSDTTSCLGFVAFDSLSVAKHPIVIIVPEWWGISEYTKGRAQQLAELGYVALAADIYGNGKTAETPEEAGAMAGPFYQNPALAKQRLDAAIAYAKTIPQADTTKVVAIGYCFGGGLVLNAARLGEDIQGVVSFHGSLIGAPLQKELLKAKVLVLHGEADQFVKAEEVAMFKKQMDSIQADYRFVGYPETTHAFTNPKATETGKKYNLPIAYNAAADSASFQEMLQFFDSIFK